MQNSIESAIALLEKAGILSSASTELDLLMTPGDFILKKNIEMIDHQKYHNLCKSLLEVGYAISYPFFNAYHEKDEVNDPDIVTIRRRKTRDSNGTRIALKIADEVVAHHANNDPKNREEIERIIKANPHMKRLHEKVYLSAFKVLSGQQQSSSDDQ